MAVRGSGVRVLGELQYGSSHVQTDCPIYPYSEQSPEPKNSEARSGFRPFRVEEINLEVSGVKLFA